MSFAFPHKTNQVHQSQSFCLIFHCQELFSNSDEGEKNPNNPKYIIKNSVE